MRYLIPEKNANGSGEDVSTFVTAETAVCQDEQLHDALLRAKAEAEKAGKHLATDNAITIACDEVFGFGNWQFTDIYYTEVTF